jgi:hypothetical protein
MNVQRQRQLNQWCRLKFSGRVFPFKIFSLIFLPTFICLSTVAASVTFQSSETQASLLELYTSEGCSSCPPAEKWFSSLKTSSALWKDFVPVAFHVDYWDYLGWHDPWASGEFTDRQHAYARAWRSDSVYTPEFALNGKEWRAWSRSRSFPTSTAKPGILKVTSADLKNWAVTFAPTTASGETYEAHAALLASGLTSNVKAGENKGQRLEHDFIVTRLKSLLLSSDGNKAQGSFELALPKGDLAKSSALAVWVTRSGSLEPLQATGGWLP